MNVLSEADLKFFDENGYVIVRNAVPPRNVQAVVDAIYDFLEIPRQKDDSWYRPPVDTGGMVEMYQHQALWDNRQHPRVYEVYRQLLGRDDLWVSIDRATFKPPPDERFPQYQKIGFMHLDADPYAGPVPFGLQGVLYLTDTSADQGGFHCMPGWHKRTDEWMKLAQKLTSKPNANSVSGPALSDLPDRTPIEGKAGELVIWNRALPHGNGWNTSQRPRLAQYILMMPARDVNSEQAATRIKVWREHSGPIPNRAPFPGDPRGWENKHLQPAKLTDLGETLLGLKAWG
jgi:ectoine hydroxylase-related dioxygenase (phytanoyl-CoA dioxygenase family)